MDSRQETSRVIIRGKGATMQVSVKTSMKAGVDSNCDAATLAQVKPHQLLNPRVRVPAIGPAVESPHPMRQRDQGGNVYHFNHCECDQDVGSKHADSKSLLFT